jgi:hypothetical protein
MPIIINGVEPSQITVGATPVREVWVGGTQVWPSTPPSTPFDYTWTSTANGVWTDSGAFYGFLVSHPTADIAQGNVASSAIAGAAIYSPTFTITEPWVGPVTAQCVVDSVVQTQSILSLRMDFTGAGSIELYRGSWGSAVGTWTETEELDIPAGTTCRLTVGISGSSILPGTQITISSCFARSVV